MQSAMWTYEVEGDLVGIEALALPGAIMGLGAEAGDVVVLGLKDARRMDASGLAAVVRLYSALTHEGVTLKLEGVRGELAAQLRELGLSEVFPVQRAAKPRSLSMRLAQLVGIVW